jgi:hypothetical protein
MKILITTAVLLVLACLQTRSDWNEISPLFSNRADVSKRLGASQEKCDCLFRTSAETVFIDYAEGPCIGPMPGWNVRRGTVLRIRVTPTTPLPFDPHDVTDFIKTTEGVVTTFYTSVKKGIKYAVQNNQLIYTEYIPSSRDNILRCAGFPSYDGGVREYEPFDSFAKKSDTDMFGRLDNFAIQLTNDLRVTGYVISYAGKVSAGSEAMTLARKARDYLIKKRHIPPNRVVTVDGGFRQDTELELYLVGANLPAPSPKPTLSSTQVTVKKN